MFNGGEDIEAIVVDIGTVNSRIGFAGEDSPRCLLPSQIGIEGKNYYIENEVLACHAHENVDVRGPLVDGLVKEWDIIENIIGHATNKSLNIKLNEHPVLLAEPSFTTLKAREQWTELLFEKYDVPAVFVSKTSVLSCYANGRSSGLVVDIGGGSTTVVPVSDGYALTKNMAKSNLCGMQIDNILMKKLQDNKVPINLSTKSLHSFKRSRKRKSPLSQEHSETVDPKTDAIADVSVTPEVIPTEIDISLLTTSYQNYWKMEGVRELKETVCRVSDALFDEAANAQIPKISYELPDGIQIEVGTERFMAPESLFLSTKSTNKKDALKEDVKVGEKVKGDNPGYESIQKIICDVASNCEMDLRRDLLSNIVLTGGSSCFENLQLRLEREVALLVPPAMKVKVLASHIPERKIGAWLGGSILASLGSFHEMWMSRSEYAEHGARLVHRKCP